MTSDTDTEAATDEDLHLTCRNLLFREGRDEGEAEAECADMCRTPVGLISILDCPVWLGRHCRFFAPREGDPEVFIEADLEDLREVFRRDYMRWRYWRRVKDLREPPEAEDAGIEEEVDTSSGLREIPASPEAAAASRHQPRFPGDAPSGPPPKPVEEVDLDNLPDLLPGAADPAVEESAAAEEPPVVEESPVAEESPEDEESPVVEESPVAEEVEGPPDAEASPEQDREGAS